MSYDRSIFKDAHAKRSYFESSQVAESLATYQKQPTYYQKQPKWQWEGAKGVCERGYRRRLHVEAAWMNLRRKLRNFCVLLLQISPVRRMQKLEPPSGADCEVRCCDHHHPKATTKENEFGGGKRQPLVKIELTST